MIGEYEQQYNQMVGEKPDLIMSVCEDDMEKAYNNWLLFLLEVEKYAESQNLDIKGIKLWINVFWNADGTIDHISYYPKPNSRNMEYELLTALFKEFSKEYQSKLKHTRNYCHYGSASFPSFMTPRQ